MFSTVRAPSHGLALARMKLAKALAEGQPDRDRIVKDIITEHVREIV